MDSARVGLAAATGADGLIYIAGGHLTGYLKTFQVFNPKTGVWATLPSMPTARCCLGLATGGDGRIYAIGGFNNDPSGAFQAVGAVEAYDPATQTWATVASMPTARGGLAVASANGRIYAIGGRTWFSNTCPCGEPVATVDVYDPGTDTWVAAAPMPTAREGLAAVTAKGLIYAIGGYGAPTFQAGMATVEVYNPASETWATGPSLSQPRYNAAAAAIGDAIYVIGGSQGGDDGILGSVETMRAH
jgi:N-acetylneuraminic acid mutarotase